MSPILQITREFAQRVIEIFDLCLLAAAASELPGFYMLLPDILLAKAVTVDQKPGNPVEEDLLSKLLSQILVILRHAMATFTLYSDSDVSTSMDCLKSNGFNSMNAPQFGRPRAGLRAEIFFQELVQAQSGLCSRFI